MRNLTLVVVIVIMFLSCSNKISKPENLISEEKMVDIIYEVSLLTAAKGVNKKELEDNGIFPQEFVYSKYNIDSLQFVSSLDYYASNVDTYDNIYTKVEERIVLEKVRIEEVIAEDKKNNEKRKDNKPSQRLIDPIVDTLKVNSTKIEFEGFGLKIQETGKTFRDKDIFKLTRTHSSDTAYVRLENHKISKGETIEVSVYVKKVKDSSAFGLRISGVYPNRTDAIFDLINSKLIGVKAKGYFKNEVASIEFVNQDWYICKIKVKANINEVRVDFGPTDSNKPIEGWEEKSKVLSSLYVTMPVIKKY